MAEFHAVFMDASFANPKKTAVQCPLGRTDVYISNGEKHLILDQFEHGRTVDKVISRSSLNPQQFTVGGYLIVRSFSGAEMVYGRITRIRMMHSDRLTPAEYGALGFEDAADYTLHNGGINAGLVWVLDVNRRDVPRPKPDERKTASSQPARSRVRRAG